MLGVNIRGLDNNILVQIGLVVLIALAAKNAILIVEFARAAERDGMNRWQAAEAAAHTRLRPILMTSLAFGLGVVPLLLSSGAGAGARVAIGYATFFGTVVGTTLTLIFVPVFFVLIARIFSRRRPAATARPA